MEPPEPILIEENRWNKSILTVDDVRGGMAPRTGRVGSYGELRGAEFAAGEARPTRRQQCSQVVIRKQDGKYTPFVDGIMSDSVREAVLKDYQGEDVTSESFKYSDSVANETWSARRGFIEEVSGQRVIGPVALAVVLEEKQSQPEAIHVRTWQRSVVSGGEVERVLVGSTTLQPSQLSESGKIAWLVLQFPSVHVQSPYVEIYDTQKKQQASFAKNSKFWVQIFVFALWELVTHVYTSGYILPSVSWIALLISNGSGMRNGDKATMLREVALLAARLFVSANMYMALATVSAKELWSLFQNPREPEPYEVRSDDPSDPGKRGPGSGTVSPDELNVLRSSAIQGMAGAMVRIKPATDSQSPRVRFSVGELAQTLARIQLASGAGTRGLSGGGDHREKVLLNWMARPPMNLWAIAVVRVWKSMSEWTFWKFWKGKKGGNEKAKRIVTEDSKDAVDEESLLTNGLVLETLEENRLWLEHEVVITDTSVARLPVTVLVRARKDCGIMAGWYASQHGEDIDRLAKHMLSFPHKMRAGDSAVVNSWFGKMSSFASFARPSTWAKMTSSLREATRENLAEGIRYLVFPLLAPDQPLQQLRKRVEGLDRTASSLREGHAVRILPQRAAISYSMPGFQKPRGAGVEISQAGVGGVRAATGIDAAMKSATRSVATSRVCMRELVSSWELSSRTRLAARLFVVHPYNSLKLEPLDSFEDRILSFSPVRTTPPFEILDQERRQAPDHEIKLRGEVMKVTHTKEEAAADMALADELLHRLVNRRGRVYMQEWGANELSYTGALTDTRNCCDEVVNTLGVAAHSHGVADRNDVMFRCLKGGRGAWVLLRAMQMWERRDEQLGRQVAFPDGAATALRLALYPAKSEEQIKELARAYKKAVWQKPEAIAKIPVAALQHMLGTDGLDSSAAVDVKIVESVASFNRVKQFGNAMNLHDAGKMGSLLATMVMRPTLLSIRGPDHEIATRVSVGNARLWERIRHATNRLALPELGPPPNPDAERWQSERYHRTESLRIPGTRHFLVPYCHWIGHLMSPQSGRTLETVPVWLSRIGEAIAGLDLAEAYDAEILEAVESQGPFLIQVYDSTARPRFASCHRKTFYTEAAGDATDKFGDVMEEVQDRDQSVGSSDTPSISDAALLVTGVGVSSTPASTPEVETTSAYAFFTSLAWIAANPESIFMPGFAGATPSHTIFQNAWIQLLRGSEPDTGPQLLLSSEPDTGPTPSMFEPPSSPPPTLSPLFWRPVSVIYNMMGFSQDNPRPLALPGPSPPLPPPFVERIRQYFENVEYERRRLQEKEDRERFLEETGPEPEPDDPRLHASAEQPAPEPDPDDPLSPLGQLLHESAEKLMEFISKRAPSSDDSTPSSGDPSSSSDSSSGTSIAVWLGRFKYPMFVKAVLHFIAYVQAAATPNPTKAALLEQGSYEQVQLTISAADAQKRTVGDKLPPKRINAHPLVGARVVEGPVQAVQGLITHGHSGKLAYRASVIIWNCERIVQSVLLMPRCKRVRISYPSRVKAAKAVPSSDAMKRVSPLLVHKIRLAVSLHFQKLHGSQSPPLVIPSSADPTQGMAATPSAAFSQTPLETSVSSLDEFSKSARTGPSRDNVNRVDGPRLPPEHWDSPATSSDSLILDYCKHIDAWTDDFTTKHDVSAERGEVMRLYGIYNDVDRMHALTRQNDYATWIIQKNNNDTAREINQNNRDMFRASVVLAGAILSCITTPPTFEICEQEDDAEEEEPRVDVELPKPSEVQTYYHTEFKKEADKQCKSAMDFEASYTELLKEAGLDKVQDYSRFDQDGEKIPMFSEILSEPIGDSASSQTRDIESTTRLQIAESLPGMLDMLEKACKDGGALTLGELALLCAAR